MREARPLALPWVALGLMAAAIVVSPEAVRADANVPCPRAEHLPLLTIDNLVDPAVPVIDKWQVTFQGVPLSDAQITRMARNDALIEVTHEEMKRRGTWVYIGMATAAAGTALSSIGWVLFGQNNKDVPQSLALSMAIGGVAIGGAGTLLVTESIQTPIEPHIAPTPRHRLTRDQLRQLVASTNARLYAGICAAVERAANDKKADTQYQAEMQRAESQPIIIPSEDDAPPPTETDDGAAGVD